MAVLTMIIAPFIMHFPEGIFTFMVKVDSLFGAPILMTMILAYFSKTVSAKVANSCVILFLVVYATLMLVIQPELHYLHYMAILFTCFLGLALIIGKLSGHQKEEIKERDIEGVDTTPWKHFKPVAILATVAMAITYVVLSPWGLVESTREKTIELGIIIAGVIMAFVLFGVPLLHKKKNEKST